VACLKGKQRILVIATIKLAAGRRADFLKEFHLLMPLVQAEAGCLEYGPAIDRQPGIPGQPAVRDDVVTVVEKWESLPALHAHLAAPHMETYRNTVSEMVTGVEIRVLDPA
jgi:quinol monooxygenase YgiN